MLEKYYWRRFNFVRCSFGSTTLLFFLFPSFFAAPFVRFSKLLQFVCIHYNTDEHIIIFMFIPISGFFYLALGPIQKCTHFSLSSSLNKKKTFLLDGKQLHVQCCNNINNNRDRCIEWGRQKNAVEKTFEPINLNILFCFFFFYIEHGNSVHRCQFTIWLGSFFSSKCYWAALQMAKAKWELKKCNILGKN